nr:altronate dehydratase family protein [Maliibacterium massiliense]
MDVMRINGQDNVVVALRPLEAGQQVCAAGQALRCRQAVPFGHKIALAPIARGERIIKYGAPIGEATQDIAPGEHVHTHNVRTLLSDVLSYAYVPSFTPLAPVEPETFLGYARPDGRAGIRNEIWIVPTVGCINASAQAIARACADDIGGGVEGVYAFPHPYGCSQLGQDHKNTQRALAGLVRHPNTAGVLVLGLGCENNNIDAFKQALGPVDGARVRFLAAQSCQDEVAEGARIVRELIEIARGDCRVPLPVSKLVVGLKCGGSDGLSGITANPLLGAFSDALIARGGTSILTEVPEMFGAERLLMRRCISRAVFDKTVDMINGFKQYFMRHGQPVYENPSPGNKTGGITTLEDKSLGCTQKGGNAPVVDVLDYGRPVASCGLNLLTGPGNDLVAASALAVSGAHLVLFTTGRGTPFGCPVPTVKVASNSALAAFKRGWIDFDAGPIAQGEPLQAAAERFFQYIRSVASGQARTQSEKHGVREIAIFKDGVTL